MKKIVIPVIGFLLAGLVLVGIFWDPIIDWLPIDQSGWDVLENGGQCYLDEDGDPITGWQELDSKTYYFDPQSFAMQTGWLNLEDGRYYLGDDGVRRTGWQTADSKRYYLGNDGAMVTGWLQQEDGTRYLNVQGNPHTGWLELDDSRYYLDEEGMLHSGWLEVDGGKYYLGEDGIVQTGWQTIDGERYYFEESGIMQTGWLELGEYKYYFKEDGTAAKGKLIIDEETYYFTSTGANVILVNRWNPLPWDYEPEVTEAVHACWMAVSCSDATRTMLEALESAVGTTGYLTGYRSYGSQYLGFYTKVDRLVQKGYSYSSAVRNVRRGFAVPGTSEHQLGMAVDIMEPTDTYYENENNAILQWLKEHCWEYGFIMRYPNDKSHITGIIYEPWHYRYVGVELAMELKDSGLCLEEYLDALTNDGTTCGDPAALKSE